jgi:hypothetical protein
MRRRLLPVLALALLVPASIGITSSAEAAKPRCNGVKATIVGTNKPEKIKGTKGRDVIVARGGNDRIKGLGGNDLVCGGGGNDTIDGDAGTDFLYGGPGRDTMVAGPGAGGFVYGEAGDDLLATGDGGQALYGGDGDDVLKTAWEGSLLQGQGGDDQLYGGASADVIEGGDGNDRISAGGGDDVQLNGGFGIDTCDGGPGRDNCHGGAPGGPANSPTDPDICTAEVKQSCQGSEFPDRWLAKVTGRETDEYETRTWTMQMVLVRHGDPATTTIWKQESVTGSFSVSGSDDDCTWIHSGPLDSDFTGDLGLVPAEDLYWLDVVAGGRGERSVACANGGGGTELAYFQAWGATDGGPEAIAWDRTRREITGTWEKDGTYEDIDVDWVITPLD